MIIPIAIYAFLLAFAFLILRGSLGFLLSAFCFLFSPRNPFPQTSVGPALHPPSRTEESSSVCSVQVVSSSLNRVNAGLASSHRASPDIFTRRRILAKLEPKIKR